MSENIKIGNMIGYAKILESSYDTISSIREVNNVYEKYDKLQKEIDIIKKHNRRKNWVGNKNITYRRRRYQ